MLERTYAVKKTSISLLLAAALALPGFVLSAAPLASAQERAPAARGGCEDGHAHRGRGRHHRDPAQRLARLSERLGLDANQQALVRQAFDQARAEHQALREQPRSPERREAHRAIMQRTMERIDAILTPEQRATFDAMRAERRERMEQHRARRTERRGGAQPGRSGAGAGGVDPRGI